MESAGVNPESLNALSAKLEVLQQQMLLDLDLNIAKCQLQWIRSQKPDRQPDLSKAKAELDRKLLSLQEQAIALYARQFQAKEREVAHYSKLVEGKIQAAKREMEETKDLKEKKEELKGLIVKTKSFFQSLVAEIPFLEFSYQSPVAEVKSERAKLYQGTIVTDLYSACRLGDLDFIVKMSKSSLKRDLNTPDANGNLPIELAAANGHLPIVAFLLENGADVPPLKKNENHAVHWAAKFGRTDIVTALVDASPELLDAPGACGRAPIHYSTRNGHEETTRFLVGRKAKLNVQGDRENLFQTPMHCTIEQGHEHILRILLGCDDLDVNKRDANEKPPLDLAMERGLPNLMKMIISHKSWNCPRLKGWSTTKIKLFCQVIVDLKRTKEFLGLFEKELIDLRRVPSPENLALITLYQSTIMQLLEGHTDVQVVLSGRKIAHPLPIETIHLLGQRVFHMVFQAADQIPEMTDFLETALFMHPGLVQALEDPLIRLDPIVLACSIGRKFEAGSAQQLSASVQAYQKDPSTFDPLLSKIKTLVLEGVDEVLTVKKEKREEPKPKSPTPPLPPPTPPTVPLITPFPLKALTTLLGFAKEVDFVQMLKKSSKEEVQPSRLYAWFGRFVTPQPGSFNFGQFLAANMTFSQCSSLLYLGWSKLSYSNLYQLIAKAISGEDIKNPNPQLHGKWTPLLGAIRDLNLYFNSFGQEQLDSQRMILDLLLSKELNAFLRGRSTDLDQLALICSSLEIPGLTQAVAKDALTTFAKLQDFVLALSEKERERLKTLNDVFTHLALKPKELEVFLNTHALPLYHSLQTLIGQFLQPQVSPYEVLAAPILDTLLKVRLKLTSFEKRCHFPEGAKTGFYDRKSDFEGHPKEILVLSPLDQYVRQKRCDRCRFTTDPLKPDEPTTLNSSFDDSAFDGFHFKETEFREFQFKHVLLLGSDFSAAQFVGKIHFEEVYIDAKTAQTFLPALESCLERGLCTVSGKITLIPVRQGANPPVSVSPSLKKLVNDPWPSFATLDEDEIEYEAVFHDLEKDPDPTVPNLSPPIETTSSLRRLIGGMGRVLGDNVHYLTDFFTQGGHGKLSEELTLELRQMKEQMELLSDDQKKSEQERADLKATVKYLDSMLMEDHHQLSTLTPLFEKLMIKDKEKGRIKSEQFYLLTHPDPSMGRFYQTLHSDLSSIFHAVFLTQNPLEFIKPVLGTPGKIATRCRSGMLVEMMEKDPSFLSTLSNWLNKLLQFKGDAFEVLEKARHGLGQIPYVGAAVKAAAEVAIEAHDRTKLEETRKVLLGQNLKSLDRIAEEHARVLSLAYEDQICLLTEEGARSFAECGTLRIVAALLTGLVRNFDQFADEVVLMMRMIEVQHNRTFLGVQIPWTQSPLETKDPKTGPCTGDELFRLSGVAVQVGSNWNYFSNDRLLGPSGEEIVRFKSAPITNAKAFGYVKVRNKKLWQELSSTLPPLARDEKRLHADCNPPSGPDPKDEKKEPATVKPTPLPSIRPAPSLYHQGMWQIEGELKGLKERLKALEEKDQK